MQQFNAAKRKNSCSRKIAALDLDHRVWFLRRTGSRKYKRDDKKGESRRDTDRREGKCFENGGVMERGIEGVTEHELRKPQGLGNRGKAKKKINMENTFLENTWADQQGANDKLP